MAYFIFSVIISSPFVVKFATVHYYKVQFAITTLLLKHHRPELCRAIAVGFPRATLHDSSTHRARLVCATICARGRARLSFEPLGDAILAKYVRTRQFRGVYALFLTNGALIPRLHQLLARRGFTQRRRRVLHPRYAYCGDEVPDASDHAP